MTETDILRWQAEREDARGQEELKLKQEVERRTAADSARSHKLQKLSMTATVALTIVVGFAGYAVGRKEAETGVRAVEVQERSIELQENEISNEWSLLFSQLSNEDSALLVRDATSTGIRARQATILSAFPDPVREPLLGQLGLWEYWVDAASRSGSIGSSASAEPGLIRLTWGPGSRELPLSYLTVMPFDASGDRTFYAQATRFVVPHNSEGYSENPGETSDVHTMYIEAMPEEIGLRLFVGTISGINATVDIHLPKLSEVIDGGVVRGWTGTVNRRTDPLHWMERQIVIDQRAEGKMATFNIHVNVLRASDFNTRVLDAAEQM